MMRHERLLPAMALACLACGLGCLPRRPAEPLPPGVRSLRQQLRKKTITIPAWTREVAEELAASAADYAGKTLVVELAHLDPRSPNRVEAETFALALRSGGLAVGPTGALPPYLREWTGAPLKLRGVLHPPRRPDDAAQPSAAMLRVESIDLAHPLELAAIEIERAQDGAWLVAHVENYRAEGARATLDVCFDTLQERRRLPAVAPGQATSVRLKLPAVAAARWAELPPEKRSLCLLFDDGSTTRVDLGKWLEGPPDSLLDWGYTFAPPGDAVMVLSADRPEAELERFAALELRSYFAQFTDANIEPREPDAEEPLPAQPLLVVGTPPHNRLAAELAREAGLEDRLRKLGDDGYLLKSLRHGDRPALLIAAATPRGLVYGVYALLEHYGVQFSMAGARLPARGPFHVVDVDEARAPVFARRSLVAAGPEPTWAARWSQWQWLSMVDLAAKNRFNEAVMPLDGLEDTFRYEAGKSRTALFPFEVGPYSCLAEARLAHQRGLAIVADYTRRRGLELAFARRSTEGKLCRAAPPACLPVKEPHRDIGQPIEVLDDPGDFLGLLRVEETAKRAAGLLASKAAGFAAPYRSGAASRVSFLAQLAWDKALTPEAYFRRWAGTLCEGEAADTLARAMLDSDRIDDQVLAAAPRPFGLGASLVLPVEEGDAACDWARLRARAAGAPVAAQVKALRAQGQQLRDLQARIEPIHTAFREALGTVAPPWEDPLFEAAPARRRSERIAEAIYMFRALLGALASVQEAALAYYGGLADPADAPPHLATASAKLHKARRILLWVLRRAPQRDMAPTLTALAEQLGEQAARLDEVLGPAAEGEPVARLTVAGSDAVVHLFRSRTEDIFLAYKLTGDEVVQLRLTTSEARLFRRGEAPVPLRAEGGLFLVSLGRVPVCLVARRAPWPGQPTP